MIKRTLPAVAPTPVEVDDSILNLMLSQRDISIVSTPNIRRKLPQTPHTPQNSSQDKSLPSWSASKTPINNKGPPRSESTNHGKSLPRGSEPVNAYTELEKTVNSGLGKQRPSVLTTRGKMDYKKTAYLNTRSCGDTLTNETEIDQIVKQYIEGKVGWGKVANTIADERNKDEGQTPQEREGPWMKNRRENRNTQKAKLHQYKQKAYH